MKNILTGLLPYLYHDSEVLIGYMEALEAEIENIREKYGGLTDIVDIDRCPEIYLPYLAEAIQVPLIGEDPVQWRRQIKAWPEILKMRGTEMSIRTMLLSIGYDSVDIDTYWRDAEGDYVTEKPSGSPVLDSDSGLWRNSRTHYFSLCAYLNDKDIIQFAEHQTRIMNMIGFAKPYHAELLKVSIGRVLNGKYYLSACVAHGIRITVDPLISSGHTVQASIPKVTAAAESHVYITIEAAA